jgi:pimeloyl-ACP methyl ester carboxylesterase
VRLVRIDDARHFVMLDQQDRVASEVCSFLAA